MALSAEWQKIPGRWGHSFHSMCSYMAMFPPRLPHYFIEKLTDPGDVVLDPFCGRGTTPLEACVSGRVGIGVDLNPLAYTLTRAKIDPPELTELEERLRELENDMFFSEPESEPDDIRMLFHPTTLGQLVYLKQVLDPGDRCDNFIIATILGIMHGKSSRNQKSSSFLSISMPNTFSMSPNYIRGFVKKNNLVQIPTDVFAALRKKFRRLFAHQPPQTRGYAHLDSIENLAALRNPHLRKKRVKLIVTSPPYLKVVRYGLYNWIRLWFLDGDPGRLDRNLATYRRLPDYLSFLQIALDRMYGVLAPGGVVCLVVGDVASVRGRYCVLAEEIRDMLKETGSPFKCLDIIEDRLEESRKVTKIWRDKKGKATPIDRILVLYRDEIRERRREVDWSPPARYRVEKTLRW